MQSGFTLFGTQHLVVLAITVFLPAALIVLNRFWRKGIFDLVVRWSMAVILLANRVWALQIARDLGVTDWRYLLPLHLCDVANFAVIIACLTKHAELVRITYFFALAGTLQAILTPDIRVGFPEPRFITFFVSHCGIVIASVYLTVAHRIHPDWGSLLRAFLWLQLYAIIAGLANWLLGTNYGYLARKPENPSLLDFLGPWPWYILALEVLALIKFTLVLTPFLLVKLLFRRTTPNAES